MYTNAEECAYNQNMYWIQIKGKYHAVVNIPNDYKFNGFFFIETCRHN